MKNELTDTACILAALNQTPATGPVAIAWEDSEGKTVMCNIPRHLARQLLASKDAGALLTESLKSANSRAEQFERKSYLLGDQIEAKDAEIAALRKAGQVPEGYKLVPLEPTQAMCQAGCLSQQATPEYARAVLAAQAALGGEAAAWLVEVPGAPVYDKIVRRADVAEGLADKLQRDSGQHADVVPLFRVAQAVQPS